MRNLPFYSSFEWHDKCSQKISKLNRATNHGGSLEDKKFSLVGLMINSHMISVAKFGTEGILIFSFHCLRSLKAITQI